MLIYLADLVHNQLAGTYVVPLNVANISAYLRHLYPDIQTKLFKFPNDLLSALEQKSPDILALSNYFWNMDLNQKICAMVREKYPNTIIIVGGPSINPDNSSLEKFLRQNTFVDAYIPFEGEQVFANLVDVMLKDEIKEIPGLAYLEGDELVYTFLEPSDLEGLPSPYLNGSLDEFLAQGLAPLFESNRGCPFPCTYCTWGKNIHKVRKFPVERILAEMEYVAANYPKQPYWMFADANFGLFDRDLDIARKIREIKDRTPQLKKIWLWMTKNKEKQNIEIARAIGDLEHHLIAVQTFDPEVQKNIKRTNIRQDDIEATIQQLAKEGIQTSTDVLCGLPGETAKSHLDTLRKCFDLGFDFIDVTNILLLPGSEMETEESREQYGLIGQFRVRQGSYGEYKGIRAIEYEEIIRKTSTFSEAEMLDMRLLHWLIWYWNAGFFKSLLKFCHRNFNINPIDIVTLITVDGFKEEAKKEWFPNAQAFHEYYDQDQNWQNLMKTPFSKLNFKYTALSLLNKDFFNELHDKVTAAAIKLTNASMILLNEVNDVLKERYIHPDLFYGGSIPQKQMNVSAECLSILFGKDLPSGVVQFFVEPTDIEAVKGLLMKYNYDKFPLTAVEKTLEPLMSRMTYQIRCVS
jgi:radical SAM superfamily enzyme YgiQ (UPF0313 family)